MSEMKTLTVNGKSYTLSDEVARERLGQLAEAAAVQAPAIVCQAAGTAFTLDDSAHRPLQGLRIFGRTTQAGSPSPDAPQPLSSVGDGGRITVTVSGEAPSAKTLAVETPGGLPGIPVAADGNYTDGNGQQWVCDEVDLARGVYIQRVGRITFNGQEGWTAFNPTTHPHLFQLHQVIYSTGQKSFMNTAYPYYAGNYNESMAYFSSPYENGGFMVNDIRFTTAEEFKEHLAQSPVEMVYMLRETAETPLDEMTLAAYAALHTNKSATTVLNDAGAHMELSYVADTKVYIDRRLGL